MRYATWRLWARFVLLLVSVLAVLCLGARFAHGSEPWRLNVEYHRAEPDMANAYRWAAGLDTATTFVLLEHPQRYHEEVWPLSVMDTPSAMALMVADVVWTPQVIAGVFRCKRDRANVLAFLGAVRLGFFANNLTIEARGRF